MQNTVRLLDSTEVLPADLEAILLELGRGDSRFDGTCFGRGRCSLEEFLQECRDGELEEHVPIGWVPQSVLWLVNHAGQVVGIVRIRHRLNPRLTQYGGHIGYYIKSSERRKGYGTLALRLSLPKLRDLGESRALLTVHPENIASTRIILANGGVADGRGADLHSREVVNRYWIDL